MKKKEKGEILNLAYAEPSMEIGKNLKFLKLNNGLWKC